MIYSKVELGDNGLYSTSALTDEKKRCFVQLNGVKILDASDKNEIIFDPVSETNMSKIEAIHVNNLQAALDNSKEWFGRELSDTTIQKAYLRDETGLSADRIEATKVFDARREPLEFDSIQNDMTCTLLVEFSGLWFAKKAFGATWNIVQLKIHDEETPDEPETSQENQGPELEDYPEDYIIEDEEAQ